MVENIQIDIGVVEGPVNNKNLITSVCWDDELVVVMPVAILWKGPKSLPWMRSWCIRLLHGKKDQVPEKL